MVGVRMNINCSLGIVANWLFNDFNVQSSLY